MIKKQSVARQEWISACEFHPLSGKEVLREVCSRIAQFSRPVVLLDLDSTVYNVGPRSFQILKDWVQDSSTKCPLEIQKAVFQLENEELGYSVLDVFSTFHLALQKWAVQKELDSAQSFWWDRFFTHSYLTYDRPYLGAAEFTQQLHQLGAEMVYLTGRDACKMGDGTRTNLIRDGFAWGTERTHLLLKSSLNVGDLEHKRAAAEWIQNRGTLVASFENEPSNLVALQEIFPQAMHIFVDTVCSQTPAQPTRDIYRISHLDWVLSGGK